LKLENSRLRDELDSLKAMYARRISHDERIFEEQIRLKDEECERWFRAKKTDIKKMQSALVIMRSLFERKRRKFAEDMQAQSEKFDAQKATWIEDIRKLKAETEAEKAACRKELQEKTVEWQKKIQTANDDNKELQLRVRSLEESLADKKVECEKLRKEASELSRTMEQLKARLLEVERADELLKRNSQIEALEAELKRTKKMMHERAHAEADALRRELMEYVKFIVHILPEEWQSKAKDMAENSRLPDGMPQPPRSAPAGGTRKKNPRQKSAAQQAQGLYQAPSSLHGYVQAVAPESASQHPEIDGNDF
jgi:chromosome segregation ATPase